MYKEKNIQDLDLNRHPAAKYTKTFLTQAPGYQGEGGGVTIDSLEDHFVCQNDVFIKGINIQFHATRSPPNRGLWGARACA